MGEQVRIRVLLVEDDPAQVKLARVAIEKANQVNGKKLVVEIARDGEEALLKLRQGQFDLILLDLRLPRKDGLEVLREIKSDSRLAVMPVVILTTSDMEQDMLAAYRSHVNAYMVKPLNQNKLVDLMKRFKEFWAAEQVRLVSP